MIIRLINSIFNNRETGLFGPLRGGEYILQSLFLYEKVLSCWSYLQWYLVYLPFVGLNEYKSSKSPYTFPKKLLFFFVVYAFGGFQQVGLAMEAQTTCQVRSFIEGTESSCKSSSVSVTPTASKQPLVLIFVSSSMPLQTLRNLQQSADKVGGVLVFRGLINNSFKETSHYIKELGTSVWIDPTLFKDFSIVQVPTFVILEKPYNKEHVSLHDKIAGNISLAFALEKASKTGQTSTAGILLHRLGGRKR